MAREMTLTVHENDFRSFHAPTENLIVNEMDSDHQCTAVCCHSAKLIF